MIESHQEIESKKNELLEAYKSHSLYLKGKQSQYRLYGEPEKKQIDVQFYCAFTTKPHYLLQIGNASSQLDALIQIEGELYHEQLIWNVYQVVKELYPNTHQETLHELVYTVCETCYEELEKFDSDFKEERMEDPEQKIAMTVQVITSKHLCLTDRDYIQEICEKGA